MSDPLAELTDAGVAVWLDDLSRDRITRQPARAHPRPHVRRRHDQPDHLPEGARARATSTTRSSRDLAVRGVSTSARRSALITTDDVRWALRRAAPGRTTRSDGVDGRVSIEVDPRIAHDTDKTIAEARALWWLVDRPNLFIKIPATTGPAGHQPGAVRRHQRQRHPDLQPGRYDAGDGRLPRRPGAGQGQGHRPVDIGSVASFFVSRVDTEVDKRLGKIGTDGGQGAARQGRRRQCATGLPALRRDVRHRPLEGAGRRRSPSAAPALGIHRGQGPELPRHACTSTELVAPDTVNTMPEATMQAVYDHGVIERRHGPRSLRRRPAGARRPRAPRHRLRRCRRVLEREGVEKFEDSWTQLIETIEPSSAERVGRSGRTEVPIMDQPTPAPGTGAGESRR